MNKYQTAILVASFLTLASIARAQESNIVLPVFDDIYSKYVRQLENRDLNIDFTDFRNSFLESGQFLKKGTNYDSLRKLVYVEIRNKNYDAVIRLTKAMLSIDYTSLFAHKYLQQSERHPCRGSRTLYKHAQHLNQ